MPTDIVELCTAACCIFSMALVRSPILAPRDGLDRTARTIATGMACTLLLVITNSTTYLLTATLRPLRESTVATLAPLVVMLIGALVVAFAIAASKKIHIALHRLLTSLAPALMTGTLLLGASSALLAPAQNIYHAALTAIGAGFGFALLLQLCVIVALQLDTALANKTPPPTAKPITARTAMLRRVASSTPAPTLIMAGVLALLAATLDAAW